jgi:redox-sensitive bicupin YhaK (pirin superfamily)
MSGPVDTSPTPGGAAPEPPAAEVVDARVADVGGMQVRRSLPRARRRTVGAWCFVDHLGPLAVEPGGGLDIGPHPHTGLATVTYLLEGQVLHRDSLGSEQVISPGQLNLMTAGRGVSHAEEPTGHYAGTMHGVQLWVAQPSATRSGDPAFEHHGSLPEVTVDGADVTLLVGSLGSATSPARRDSDLVGAAVDLGPDGAVLPLTPAYEHLVVVLDGVLLLQDGRPVRPGQSAYLGRGRDELELAAPEGARVLLLGGTPFEEQIVMWWNFVGRSREEVASYAAAWAAADERFGSVATSLERIPAPAL